MVCHTLVAGLVFIFGTWHSGFIALKARKTVVWDSGLSPWYCRVSTLVLLLLFSLIFLGWDRAVTYPLHIGVLGVGILMIVAGLGLAIRAMQEVKGSTGILVTDGLYSFVRHPAYTGVILFFVGCAVVLSNSLGWVGFGGLSLYTIIGALLEDRRLIREVNGYREYAGKRGLLFPWRRNHFRKAGNAN
ncbi:MAG: methyltransferase family protein [Candidatus Hodarchaeota archaeon]